MPPTPPPDSASGISPPDDPGDKWSVGCAGETGAVRERACKDGSGGSEGDDKACEPTILDRAASIRGVTVALLLLLSIFPPPPPNTRPSSNCCATSSTERLRELVARWLETVSVAESSVLRDAANG